jgi:glycosyltransferase involved in cell wall biosynthesis
LLTTPVITPARNPEPGRVFYKIKSVSLIFQTFVTFAVQQKLMSCISVVIITFNEEHNIARCIQSVQCIADDIVVVDSFSTDNTEKICESFGVRFVQHEFKGHIEQKNWAITQAKFPHILSLDADEALDEKLQNSIIEIKDTWPHDGYYMNRLTNYCGKWIHHCGWYPDTKLRLWDSRKGKWGGVNPHDKFEMYDGDINTTHIHGNILHYSYYSIDDHYKQVNYFTDILAKSQFDKGKKASLASLYISPVIKFIRGYFFMLGILDGASGFTICRISAYATYLKYSKLRKLHLANPKSQ